MCGRVYGSRCTRAECWNNISQLFVWRCPLFFAFPRIRPWTCLRRQVKSGIMLVQYWPLVWKMPVIEGSTVRLSIFIVSFSALSCPNLSSPSNGNIALSSSNFVGSIATYSCNSGYKATFSSTRYCQADGQWSGGAPSCIRKCLPLRS